MIKITLEIIKKKEMPLLSRKRVTAVVNEKGPTPSRKSLKQQIAKKINDARKDH